MATPKKVAPGDRMTVDELYRMPNDGYKYELVRGRLQVSEPPGFMHGWLAGYICELLNQHARPRKLGFAAVETGYWLERGPDTVRGADVSFVRADRVPGGRPGPKFVELGPDLAVEVLSPDDRPGKMRERIRDYLRGGTRLIWIVDPKKETVTVHAPDAVPRVLAPGDEVDGGDVLPGFRCPVRALVHGPDA